MRVKINTVLSLFILLSLAIASHPETVPAASTIPWQEKIDPQVLNPAFQGETEYLVILSEQADLSAATRLQTKSEKGTYVFQTLVEVAKRTQSPILRALDALDVEHRAYWIVNLVWVRGDQDSIQAMAERPDVTHIYANPTIRLDEPSVEGPTPLPLSLDLIRWNITKINADDVWAAGYDGGDVVIGGQDTGYDWDHPALKNQYRGWNGSSANHDYNWHDAIHSGGGVCGADSDEPCDDYGHGTHTMGIMVGDDGGANQIGVAPGAKWIGCRNMDQGVGSPATYIECYQWFIAPTQVDGSDPQPALAPDVINNSWSCPTSEGCNPDSLKAAVQAVNAAGILTVHSAGNAGSSCSSVNTPGAIYEESFTVGSTSSNDLIAYSSSRGPVTVDGSDRLKPNVSAPGVSIYSSLRNGAYGNMSGTSMAAPHVAGTAALLISAEPKLAGDVGEIKALIEGTAVPRIDTTCGGSPGGIPNNVYGWGRINAFGAFNGRHQLLIDHTVSSSQIAPNSLLTYTFTIHHTHLSDSTSNVILTDRLPENTTFVSASPSYTLNDDTVRWDFSSIGVDSEQTATLVVQVNTGATGSILNTDYGAESDQVTRVAGETIETEIVPQSLLVSGTASSATIAPGRWLTYTLMVSNPHQFATTHHTLLVDTLPQGTDFITATTPHTLTGDTITWILGDLAPQANQGAELVVQVHFTATVGTIINNNYHARSDEVPPVPGEAIQTLVHNLQVNKEASALIGLQGGVLTYTLTVTNMQPISATMGILLTDTVPAGTTFITATLPHSHNGGVVTWTHPSLEPNTSWQAELVVRISPTAQGILFNGLYGAVSEQATTPARGDPVLTLIHAPGVMLTPDSTRMVHPGTVVTYTHLLTNIGNLTDTFDLTLSSTQGWSTLAGSKVSLGPGESQLVIVRVIVPLQAQAGTIDETRLIATSLANPNLVAVVTDTTKVAYRACFPRIFFQDFGAISGD